MYLRSRRGIAARDQGGDVARPAQHALLLGAACRCPQPPVKVTFRQQFAGLRVGPDGAAVQRDGRPIAEDEREAVGVLLQVALVDLDREHRSLVHVAGLGAVAAGEGADRRGEDSGFAAVADPQRDALGGIDHRFQAQIEPHRLDVQWPVAFTVLRRELAEGAKRDVAPRVQIAGTAHGRSGTVRCGRRRASCHPLPYC